MRSEEAPRWKPEGLIYPGKRTSHHPIWVKERPARPALAPYIQCYWEMKWDLREPLSSEVVPSGCLNLLLEGPGQSPNPFKITGTRRSLYHKTLEGKNSLLGVRFTPGGFYPFFCKSVAALTDTILPVWNVFGEGGRELESRLKSAGDFDSQVKVFEEFFLQRAPEAIPEDLRWISKVVDAVVIDNVSTFQKLLEHLWVSESRCQRTFKKYVGVSPKFFLRTHRFQTALKTILNGQEIVWTDLAGELGYYDQSHFINDFRAITGQLPSALAGQHFAGFFQDSPGKD